MRLPCLGIVPPTLDLVILSARYERLLFPRTPVERYDQILNRQRAEAIRPEVSRSLREILAAGCYRQVCLNAGRHYLLALGGPGACDPFTARVVCPAGRSGQRQAQLKQWLADVQADYDASAATAPGSGLDPCAVTGGEARCP